MKTNKLILLGLSTALFFNACKKDEDPIDDNTTVVEVDNPNNNANGDTTVQNITFSVLVNNFEDTDGVLRFGLYNTEASYDAELNPYIGETVSISSLNVQLEFTNVPEGEYVVAVLHDQDSNGELNTNFLGAPTEGYGFSTNPGVTLSKPSFDDVSFNINGQTNQEISVDLIYVL